jgi:hypothetical protein
MSAMVDAFPMDGVRLSAFDQIIEACGGRDALAHLTTTQVCERFVKPATARLEASYCDMLMQRQHDVVGKATAFISHAWKCVFLDVVDALLAHFYIDDGDDVVVWFDVFSNNQHQEMAMDFDWCCGTFKSAIAAMGRTVMVLAPWHDPVPLTRGWCLFELYCTAYTGSTFEVAKVTGALRTIRRASPPRTPLFLIRATPCPHSGTTGGATYPHRR